MLQDLILPYYQALFSNLKPYANYLQAHQSLWYLMLIFIFLYFSVTFLRIKNKKKFQQIKIQQSQPNFSKPSTNIITSSDIRAIAGDDVMATQLDLARAYIEMDKKSLAKKILQHVSEHGTPVQQKTAQQLMQL